jgi:hypothetical protein
MKEPQKDAGKPGETENCWKPPHSIPSTPGLKEHCQAWQGLGQGEGLRG